ncbi:MAG: hypothetical protein GX493_05460 [Firmicutes bacterium]|nr:hypothetical protein [Bacillota bacterium]
MSAVVQQSGSERQWEEVLGIIKVQGDRLDRVHPRRWADLRGLRTELERALGEGGL